MGPDPGDPGLSHSHAHLSCILSIQLGSRFILCVTTVERTCGSFYDSVCLLAIQPVLNSNVLNVLPEP